jgi:DNA-directed RNA polymerase specialized sigma24 family protein
MATNYFANLQHAIAQNDEHKFFTLVFNNLGREILVRTKGYLGKSKGVIDEKDVLSEVLEKVFKKGMKHFENFDQGHFEGYLYKTAKNLCLNILERNKTLPSISSDVEEHHLEHVWEFSLVN